DVERVAYRRRPVLRNRRIQPNAEANPPRAFLGPPDAEPDRRWRPDPGWRQRVPGPGRHGWELHRTLVRSVRWRGHAVFYQQIPLIRNPKPVRNPPATSAALYRSTDTSYGLCGGDRASRPLMLRRTSCADIRVSTPAAVRDLRRLMVVP